jgi:hypothetical protein
MFSPPDTNDWLLVLDAASANFLPPGQMIPLAPPAIRAEGQNVILSWETGDGLARLEVSSDLGSASVTSSWSSALGFTNAVGNQTEVTRPMSEPARYFRLRRP